MGCEGGGEERTPVKEVGVAVELKRLGVQEETEVERSGRGRGNSEVRTVVLCDEVCT